MVRVTGKVAALYRVTAPGVLRGLILEECAKRGLRIGYPPALNPRTSSTDPNQTQR